MPGHYLPDGAPDLDDFFAQVVPAPPATGDPAGVAFMGPLDATGDLWFAYHRRGPDVARFEAGPAPAAAAWMRAQPAGQRWVWDAAGDAYVPLDSGAGQRVLR